MTLDASFNGINLLGPEPQDFAQQPGQPGNPVERIEGAQGLSRAVPAFDGEGCLISIPAPYYAYERGFRFRICMAELADIRTLLTSGVPGSAVQRRLVVRSLSAPELKRAFPEMPQIVLRDRDQIPLASLEERLTGSILETDFPVVFPGAAPELVVRHTGISLVYEAQTGFLLIEIEDPLLSAEFGRALARTQTLVKEMPANSAHIFVSEIYFPSQGTPFVELTSAADGRAEAVLVSDLGARLELRGSVFAGSAIVPAEFSFKNRVDLTTAARNHSVTETSLPQGAGKIRSHSADGPGTEENLLPSIFCGAADEGAGAQAVQCHTRGVSPVLLARGLPAEDARFCKPEDLSLRELNPFGIDTDGALNPAGKFIEFEVMRSCDSGRIVLFAPLEVDPGHRRLEKHQLIVFAADAQYFESGAIENSRIRSLAADRPVQILSLTEYSFHTVFAGASPDELWIPRSRGRVHSLLIDNQAVIFHGPGGAGMRPDQAHNAMSPGHPANSAAGQARLSELYPTGSYHTSSIPGDEFFEIEGTEGSGMFTLEVVRMRDGRRVLHRFPPPNSRAAYFAAVPVCFQTDWIKASSLFLPNEPAQYTLYDSEGRVIDRVEIAAALYAAMERDRRSIAADAWTLSAQGGSCLKSGATPGKENQAAAP